MRRVQLAAVLSLGLVSPIPFDADIAEASQTTPEADARESYTSHLEGLEKKRVDLAKKYEKAKSKKARRGIREEAARTVLATIRKDVFPAWRGTTWDYNGTSTKPGEDSIACGYYVTTVLRDVGFKVERRKLAQQPSEQIVRTLSPDDSIMRFRKGDTKLVVSEIEERGEGLYVVGLDNHVGFLHNDGKKVEFCHASYVDPAEVRCEDPLKSKAFVSNYHVVGELFTRPMIEAWLEGKAIATKLP